MERKETLNTRRETLAPSTEEIKYGKATKAYFPLGDFVRAKRSENKYPAK